MLRLLNLHFVRALLRFRQKVKFMQYLLKVGMREIATDTCYVKQSLQLSVVTHIKGFVAHDAQSPSEIAKLHSDK